MDIPEPWLHLYERTLRIVADDGGQSSSFVMDYKEQHWLVTAIHCVEESGNERHFEVLDQDGFPFSASFERVTRISPADVAVFRVSAAGRDFEPSLEPYSPHSVPVTQDLYFLGFPGLGPHGIYHLAYASPVTPVLKRAMVSGQADYPGESDPHNIKAWLLDGMSSGGFSGGPVLIEEHDGFRVFGINSSYVPANVRVNPAKVSGPSPRAGVAPLSPHDKFYETNMGLMIVFDVRYAVEAIDEWLGGTSSE
jgi:hypothetical protein